jgi:DNA repair exonuclease SbcCD ATPase subunit
MTLVMADESTTANAPKGVPENQLDGLYRGPLEDFTGARNELAKTLRSDGEPEAADWVKKLRKPSRPAWLVNQLAAHKPKDVESLLEAGRELRAAQEDMLSGSADREKLREAASDEQKTIASLVATAEAMAREHGVGPQALSKVEDTLRAASADPDVAELIQRGRLDREQRASGIGTIGALAAAPAARSGRGEREAKQRRERQQQAKRRNQAESKLAQAEKRLEREQAKLDSARERVEEAEKRVHDAELDAHAARRSLDDI